VTAPSKTSRLSPILAILLALFVHTQAQGPDEPAIDALIKSYFAAYAKKDLEGLLKFWSVRSPAIASALEDVQRSLPASEVSNVSITRLRIAGIKAVLEATAIFSVSDPLAKVPVMERRVRSFALMKEDGGWKVWRDTQGSQDLSAFLEKGSEWVLSDDSIEPFAVTLLNSSAAERQRLIEENPKMVTRDLEASLTRKVGPLQVPGSYDRAAALLQFVRSIAERLNDREGITTAEREMGDVYREWGRSDEALRHYQAAIAGFESLGRRGSKAATLVSVGQLYFGQKKHAQAIESYEKALDEYQRLNIPRPIGDTLEELASVYYDQETYDVALELFERCLKLRETYATQPEIASTQNSIGNVRFQRHEYDLAIIEYSKALAVFEKVNDPDAVVSSMSNIAGALYSAGNYESALDYYLKALGRIGNLRDRSLGPGLRLSIANIYSAQGNYGLAIEQLRSAVAGWEALGNKNKQAGALSQLADIYFQLHNYPTALENYQRSLKLFVDLSSLSDSSMTFYAIGNVRFVIGEFEASIQNYEQAQAQFEKIKHAPGVASMFASIAGVRYAQQKYDLAIESYQKALSAYQALGDNARVAGLTERIAAVHYSKGDYAASLELARRAVEMAERLSLPDTLWRASLTRGFGLRATGELDRARSSFEKSISTIETARANLVHGDPEAQHFFQTRNAPYSAMLELLVSQNKVPEAYSYAERIRSNNLFDTLQRSRITNSMTVEETEQERKLERAVIAIKAEMNQERDRARPDIQRHATLQLRLQKALDDYHSFESRLYSTHPNLRGLRGEGPEASVENADLLPDSTTALLEFAVADTRSYLFAITCNTKRRGGGTQTPSCVLNAYVIDAGRTEIAGRVRKIREVIVQQGDETRESQEVYDLLFGQAREQIGDKPNWVILPDSDLWQMPFAALRTDVEGYLIESHALSYASSLRALSLSKSRPIKTNRMQTSLLAVINPSISERSAERSKLLGGSDNPRDNTSSGDKATALERLYGQSAKILSGAEASESAFKQEAGKFRVIQLSAPAVLSDSSPMFSHVLLAQSEKDDGLLETWELSRLELKSNLVILSSSEQAFGGAGDGITSLNWMMLVAGCPSEMLTSWRTSSADSLLREVHRLLKSPQSPSMSKALQRATIRLLRDQQFHKPFNWAGVVLIGNQYN